MIDFEMICKVCRKPFIKGKQKAWRVCPGCRRSLVRRLQLAVIEYQERQRRVEIAARN